MPNGQELSFAGGELDTDLLFKENPATKEAVELELKKIANVPSSMIYTKDPVQDSSERDVVDEIMGSATVGFDSVNKVPAGTQTHELPVSKPTAPTLKAASSQVGSAAKTAAEASAASSHQNQNVGSGGAANAVQRAREQVAAANAAKNGVAAATPEKKA